MPQPTCFLVNNRFLFQGEDATSERLLRDVNNDGRIHLVPSHMKGKFFLRLAMCGPSLQSQDIVYAWDVIKDVADHVLNSHKAKQ